MKILERTSALDFITQSYDWSTNKLTVNWNMPTTKQLDFYAYWDGNTTITEDKINYTCANDLMLWVVLTDENSKYVASTFLAASGSYDFNSVDGPSGHLLYVTVLRKAEGYSTSGMGYIYKGGLIYWDGDVCINDTNGRLAIGSPWANDPTIVIHSDFLASLKNTSDSVQVYPICTIDSIMEITHSFTDFMDGDARFSYTYEGLYTVDSAVINFTDPMSAPLGPYTMGGSYYDKASLSEGVWNYTISLYDAASNLIISKTKSFLYVKPLEALMFIQYDTTNSMVFSMHNYSLGNPTSYAWDFGDGNTANTLHTSHTYTAIGTYTVTLTISKTVEGITYSEAVSQTIIVGNIPCNDTENPNYVKVECHKYSIIEKDNTGETRIAKIYTFDGVLIEELTITSGLDRIGFNGSEDGTYLVKIYGESGDLIKEFPFYDLCDILECYLNLVNSIQCPNEAKDCDNDESSSREALNRLTGLIYFIDQYIRYEVDSYLGILEISTTRMEAINKVNKFMEILKLVINDCTNCCFEENKDDCNCE